MRIKKRILYEYLAFICKQYFESKKGVVMMKEGFIIGALLGATVGIMLYKNNSDAKQAIDKGEKIIKEKIENCKKDMLQKKQA